MFLYDKQTYKNVSSKLSNCFVYYIHGLLTIIINEENVAEIKNLFLIILFTVFLHYIHHYLSLSLSQRTLQQITSFILPNGFLHFAKRDQTRLIGCKFQITSVPKRVTIFLKSLQGYLCPYISSSFLCHLSKKVHTKQFFSYFFYSALQRGSMPDDNDDTFMIKKYIGISDLIESLCVVFVVAVLFVSSFMNQLLIITIDDHMQCIFAVWCVDFILLRKIACQAAALNRKESHENKMNVCLYDFD